MTGSHWREHRNMQKFGDVSSRWEVGALSPPEAVGCNIELDEALVGRLLRTAGFSHHRASSWPSHAAHGRHPAQDAAVIEDFNKTPRTRGRSPEGRTDRGRDEERNLVPEERPRRAMLRIDAPSFKLRGSRSGAAASVVV